MPKIGLDPGHGNRIAATNQLDPGAVAKVNGVVIRKESEHQLLFAQKIKEYLETQPNTTVILLRTTNDDLNLPYRCNLDYRINKANTEGCECYVSLHENALDTSARGYEIYTQTKPTSRDNKLATAIYNAVTSAVPAISNAEYLKNKDNTVMKLVMRGIKTYDFKVCTHPRMPSCLVETLFIDNEYDRLFFDRYFDDLAKATAKGIIEGIGYTWVEPKKPEPPVVVITPDTIKEISISELKAAGFTEIRIKL